MLYKVRHMKLSYVTLCFGKYCISYLVIKPFSFCTCVYCHVISTQSSQTEYSQHGRNWKEG